MLTASDWWISHTTKWHVLWTQNFWQDCHSFKRMWERFLPLVGHLSWKVTRLQGVFLKTIYLFIEAALDLSCGWRDRDPWWGIESEHPPTTLGAQSLTPWTTSEVPKGHIIYVTALYLASCFLWNHSTCLAHLPTITSKMLFHLQHLVQHVIF